MIKWKREFWETRIQGSMAVWGLLKNACDPTCSPEDAQAFLDAAGVTAYNGSMTLCYDETGMPYRLPIATI